MGFAGYVAVCVQLYCRFFTVLHLVVTVYTTCFDLHGHLQVCRVFFLLYSLRNLLRWFCLHVVTLCAFHLCFPVLFSLFFCFLRVSLFACLLWQANKHTLTYRESSTYLYFEFCRHNSLICSGCSSRPKEHSQSFGVTYGCKYIAQVQYSTACAYGEVVQESEAISRTMLMMYDIGGSIGDRRDQEFMISLSIFGHSFRKFAYHVYIIPEKLSRQKFISNALWILF
jgi:hypothetical protein